MRRLGVKAISPCGMRWCATTATAATRIETVERYLTALARLDKSQAESCLDPDCETTILPTRLNPEEQTQFKFEVLQSIEGSVGMLEGRELIVKQLVDGLPPTGSGATAISTEDTAAAVLAEFELRGKMNFDNPGTFKKGDNFRVSITAYFDFNPATNQIVKYRSYEAYYPFGAVLPALPANARPMK